MAEFLLEILSEEIPARMQAKAAEDLHRLVTESLGKNGLSHLPIYAEVSVQQSRRPDYDPWRTARFCYEVLDRARKSAGGFDSAS